MKRQLKKVSGWLVRGLSFLLPQRTLFHIFRRLRRFHIWLTKQKAPTILLKAIDHIFYSLRPALVEGRLGSERFFIRLNDPCHYNHLLGVHEPPVVAWLDKTLRPGMHVADIGANIGFYTVKFARLVGPGGRVLSVEPDPGVADILEHNILVNKLANVDVVRAAAGDKLGTLRLGRAAASSWYTGVHYKQAAEWIEVPAYPLDLIVEERGLRPIHVVKIDVEGAETEVLQGMEELLREDRPVLLVELHDYEVSLREHPTLALLEKEGYSVDYLSNQHVIALPSKPRFKS